MKQNKGETLDHVTSTRLPNGLSVHLKEIHTAPIISHWVWYRVGSRNEVPGKTGISHWVEHMQFKGTPTFPSAVLDKAISREGGVWNAFTHLDWTTYYETLPADKIDLALRLEADRMYNSVFDPAEVEAERTVILSEREGGENEPLFRLGEAVQKAAFTVHPYGHEIIGERSDLLNVQRDDLDAHYHNYYTPCNALVAIAGDFRTEIMLARLNELYANAPAGTSPCDQPANPSILAEPPLTGEQRVEVSGPGETTYLQIAYRSPAAGNPDFFAFSVLDSLLSGPTSLNLFGGGGLSNKTSRLYRCLVERDLAVSVHGGLQATIDPFLYEVHLTVHPQRSPREVLQAFDDEVRRLQDQRVSDQEIERAIKQARALFAYGSESITNQASWLGYAEMFASYGWFTGYVEHLAAITPADVQRIAQTYLAPDNRITGIYLPTGESIDEGVDDEPDQAG
ncbi:MAG: insulinase family protein [Chloroflexi bacterium]|nr:MAG: insulinase family protein [Chloroflexota bacterium]